MLLMITYSFMILLLVAWPLLVTIFLLFNYERVDDDKFKEKYNAMY